MFSARFIEDRGAITVMEIEGNYDAKNADGSINAASRQLIATSDKGDVVKIVNVRF